MESSGQDGAGAGSVDDTPAPVSSLRALESWAHQRVPRTTFRLRGVSPSAVAPLIAQFVQLARLYPEVVGHIELVCTGELPTAVRRAEATTWARSAIPPVSAVPEIRLNRSMFLRLPRVQLSRRELVNDGWHPSGTYDPRAFMTHELGHHIMFWLQDLGVDVQARLAEAGDPRTLCEYARRHFAEAFAEAFTAQFHGDDVARVHVITRTVMQMIEREIARNRSHGSTP